MRTVWLLTLLLLLSSSTSPVPRITASPPPRFPASPPTIHDLSWLEGVWRGRVGKRDFEARYTGSDGGQILSASKYTDDGKPAGFEFERFEEQDGRVVLTPFPDGKASVTFPLVDYHAKSRKAMFENLAHDFPTRILYQRVGDDRLTILVSGPGEDGKEQVLTYALRRKRER